MINSPTYNFHKNQRLDLINELNIFKGGNIIFFCTNQTKHTKDPYILDLLSNDFQLDLKESTLKKRSVLQPLSAID